MEDFWWALFHPVREKEYVNVHCTVRHSIISLKIKHLVFVDVCLYEYGCVYVCASFNKTIHPLLSFSCMQSKSGHMKSRYISSPIANPSANVVNSHPVTDNSTQLSCSGPAPSHYHFTGVTSVATSQCYLSLPSLCWAIGAERLGKLKPHRCAAIVARYSVRGDSICLLSPLEKHWSRWNWAGVQTPEEFISKTAHYPFCRLWECNYLTSIILYL